MKRLIFVFQHLHPDRIIYLSTQPLQQMLGDDFAGDGFWEQAAKVVPEGTPKQILDLVARRAVWQHAQAVESLPEKGRTSDMLACGFVEIVATKTSLSKDDMASASVVVFGDSARPVIQKLGGRLLVSPGASKRPDSGTVLLSDTRKGTQVQLFDTGGKCIRSATLVPNNRNAQLTVKGEETR